jgi:hypothetical protein
MAWCSWCQVFPKGVLLMFNLKIGSVVHAHVFRERFDVLIAVLTPLVLMLESGYANGWVFANGLVSWTSLNTYLAMGRGVFLEGLIFVMFKLVRMFAIERKWVLIVVPLLIGSVGMIVSAGCNLGWINRSGEMTQMITMVAQFLPSVMVNVFKVGLGLLFPLSVGAFALFDISQLLEEAFKSGRHQARAMQVHMAEEAMHNTQKQMKAAINETKEQYKDIVRTDAQRLVERFRSGDRSFGLNDAAISPVQASSVTRITPAMQQQLPPAQPVFNAPAFPAGAPTGNTQNIVYPPQQSTQPMPQQQGPGWNPFNRR